MAAESKRADPSLEQTSFAGKRRALRKRRTLSIECRGPGGLRVEARTVDVSRGGMLIEITDSDAFSTDRSAPFAGRAQEIEALFPAGIDVSFGEGAVLAFAHIIRHVVDVDRPELALLGCRFAPELSPVDCRLLGIEFESSEAVGPDPADAAVPSSAARREGDDLVAFISTPGRVWSAPEGPTDSSPVAASTKPPSIGAKLVYAPKSRSTEVLVPKPAAAVSVPSADPIANPLAAAIATPAPSAEGLTDDDLRRMGRDRRKAPASAVTGKASDWAGAGRVAVYLFPSMAGALAPRYHGRLEGFDDRHVVVDLPVPSSDSDAVGHGAGLGETVRAVFVRDGHVLGESNCRVTRLTEHTVGVLRATLIPSQKPSDSLRKAIARA